MEVREVDNTHRMSLARRPTDIAAAIGWSFLTGLRLAMLIAEPSLLQAGLLVFNLLVMILFVFRREVRARGSHKSAWLAIATTYLPSAFLRPAEVGVPRLGELIQVAGIVMMLLAILSLNRSFGIAPAHRGLVSQGAYRVVRHPLYAAEMMTVGGYCLGFASVWNGAVWAAFAIGQLLRLRGEETLLCDDAEYRAYQVQVPWRLVPGVW
jgi:protein-S-isoprenylcysteine O-methyltransferase Ste14